VDLRLLAVLSRSDRGFFDRFMSALVNLFSTDRRLLEARGTLIVRHLVDALDAETVYRAFAPILAQEADVEFAAVMVQSLCLILLTTHELLPLRELIFGGTAPGRALFESLYRAWCIAPVAALSLCLLAQAYDHALGLVSMLCVASFAFFLLCLLC
jgi:vacuole morphology and inheritance protein 14